MENEEIWKIIKHDGKIYFQSFSSSFIWDGKEIRIINFKDYKPLYYHQINGKIYAQLINGPYCILEKDKYSETRPISDGFRKNNVNYWAFREIRSIIPHL